MTEYSQTVTLGGTDLEVTYDDEGEEAQVCKTDDQLTEEAMGFDHESFESLNDDVVGRSKDVTPEALQEYAERTDETYGTVRLSAEYLRDAAERIELDCRRSDDTVVLHVVKDAPLLLTSQSAAYGYMIAPRVTP